MCKREVRQWSAEAVAAPSAQEVTGQGQGAERQSQCGQILLGRIAQGSRSAHGSAAGFIAGQVTRNVARRQALPSIGIITG